MTRRHLIVASVVTVAGGPALLVALGSMLHLLAVLCGGLPA